MEYKEQKWLVGLKEKPPQKGKKIIYYLKFNS